MPIITLLTDFGLSDNYVGIMKGVLASICPSASVIDITHGIAPQDVTGAAYSLYTAYHYFPRDTIHAVVVDPGVGSGRRIIAAGTSKGIFIAPDNGVLGPVMERESVDWLINVENTDNFLSPVSSTFHGRDIFAPVAAHLAGGLDPARLGSRIAPEQTVGLEIAKPEIGEDGGISGNVIWTDRFGNIVTNIDACLIRETFGRSYGSGFIIMIRNHRIEGIRETYGVVGENMPVVLIGSGGMMEISVNRGDASQFFHAGRGDSVKVFFGDRITLQRTGGDNR